MLILSQHCVHTVMSKESFHSTLCGPVEKGKKKQNTEITRLGSSKVVVIKLTWLTDHQDCWSGAFRYTLVQFHNRSRSGCSTKLNPRSDHEMLREKPTNPKATSEVYKPQLTC